MNYIYPIQLCNHWNDIYLMVYENYRQEVNDGDLLIIGLCAYHSVKALKEMYPGYERYIVYQLEPLTEKHFFYDQNVIIERIKDADEIWDYDLDNIQILNQNGIDVKFKPFVYTDCLKRVQNWEEPDIDVLFYGSLTEGRLKILCDIAQRTLYTPFMMLTHTDGEKLDEYIARSKIIIDLHTEGDDKIQKQSRIYYALINNKCVVSQKSKRNYFKDLIIELEEDFCAGLLHTLESGNWKNYSQNTAEKFKLQSTNLINNYDLFNS